MPSTGSSTPRLDPSRAPGYSGITVGLVIAGRTPQSDPAPVEPASPQPQSMPVSDQPESSQSQSESVSDQPESSQPQSESASVQSVSSQSQSEASTGRQPTDISAAIIALQTNALSLTSSFLLTYAYVKITVMQSMAWMPSEQTTVYIRPTMSALLHVGSTLREMLR